MRKRKGFTLAELLAVIVILGIITSITVPIVTNQIDKYKTKVCVTQYDNILNAARSYAADNLVELSDSDTVTLSDLDSKGYIDASSLKDPVTKETISSELQIHIVKIGKKYKYYLDDSENIGCRDELKQKFYDEKNLFTGIPKNDYSQGDKVNYLGYNWLVMKDNENSTQLVMDGYLSTNELQSNSNVVGTSFKLGAGGEIQICGNANSLKYCNFIDWCSTGNGNNTGYRWGNSIIKPILENWLDNKMNEYNLVKSAELSKMSYSDNAESYTSWIRIPTADEIKPAYKDGAYGFNPNNYMNATYSYWTLSLEHNAETNCNPVTTKASIYYYNPNIGQINSSYTIIGTNGAFTVRPVITVNKN